MTSRRTGGLRGALATAVLCSVGAYLALELWRASLQAPLRYSQVDDTKFYLALVKDILEHGWYQHNPSLGAPFGQALYDFPQGADNLNFALIKLLGVFTSNYALVTNLFFLLTFPLTGLATFYALRRVGLGAAVACVCAVLFALAPYHFYRHESQVLLSAYYAVPLGALLFLSLFDERPRRKWPTLLVCIVIGSAGLYYAVFTVLLLLAGTAVAAFAGRRPAVPAGLLASAAIAAVLTINLSPSLVYTARHGGDPAIARAPIESEQLGLRLSTLLLPVRGDRLPPLAHVNARYAAETGPEYCESCYATLGTVGAAGFVLLGLIGLAGCVAAGREWHRPFRPAALGAGLAFVIGTTGGVGSLIAFVLTADVRGWNRISLFIAFFSLLGAGLALERAGRRLVAGGTRPAGRALAAGGLVAVLVLGGLDETTGFFVPDYAGAAREYRSDQAFGRVIDAHVSPGSSVLELPYVPFPEGFHVPGQAAPTKFSTSYELLRPYLNTHGLRWSFGAIKGRPTDWLAAFRAAPVDVVVAAAAAADFRAIYVDPRAYDPATAARVRASLTRLLGAGPLVSDLGDAWLFDLRPYLRRVRRAGTPAALAATRTAALAPLRTGCGATPGVVTLTNPGRLARSATFRATVTGTGRLAIAFPDGTRDERVLGPQPLRLRRQLVVAPGSSSVRFVAVGGPAAVGGRVAVGSRAAVGSPPAVGGLAAVGGSAAATFTVTEPTLIDRALGAGSSLLPFAGLAGPSCDEIYAAGHVASSPSF